MKQLRKVIRRIILEAIDNSKYESLVSMLDSYELESVQPAIELIGYAPDPLSNGEPYAEIISHTIHRGNSPMAQMNINYRSISQLKGTVGSSQQRDDACYHIFKLKLNSSFLEYLNQAEPENMFLQNSVEHTQIFAEDAIETWSDVSEKYNAKKSDYQVTVPV